jgi:hypothetical protein
MTTSYQNLRLPTETTGYTRTWLAYIDGELTRRAELNGTCLRDEVNELIAHADGETYYFATLYARLLKEEVAS